MSNSDKTNLNNDARSSQIAAPTGERPPLHNWLQQPDSRHRWYGWIIFAVALAVLAVLIVWITSKRKKPEEDTSADHVVSVRVVKAERGSIAAEVTALGTVNPRAEATVSSKINAQIKQMSLLKNKAVRAGDVIATLESRDLQAQRAEAANALQEAQANARLLTRSTIPEANAQDEKALNDARANVANARATYQRRLTLFRQGGISQKDLDASQLALTTAENDLRATESAVRLHQTAANPSNRELADARVKQAQDRLANLDAQLSYAVIRAPFSGVITDQFQFQGEYAAAGAKLFTIADTSEVIVKVPVADTVAAQLKMGDEATVLPQELPDEKLTGHISLISRSSDPQSRAVEIWVNLKNESGRLRVDSAAKVVVATQADDNAVTVPTSAVTLEATNQDEGTVMTVDAGSVAHETTVTIGIRTPDRIQITKGLNGGETVVVEGNYSLPDKTKVEVTEADKEDSGDKKGGDKDDDKDSGGDKE